MAETFNRQVWEATALLQRLEAISGTIFDTLSYKIDTKDKEAVNVPVITSNRRAQRTGDTVITPLDKAIIKIPTDKKSYFGVPIPDDDIHATDVDIVDAYSKIGMSEVVKDIEIGVTEIMVGEADAGNRVQFTDLEAGATGFTLEILLSAQEKFDTLEVPLDERYLRVTPKHRRLLIGMKDPDTNEKLWIKTEKNDEVAKSKGIIAEIMGFKVQVSNRIAKVKTDGTFDAVTPANNTQAVSIFYSGSSTAIGVDEEISVRNEYDVITEGGQENVVYKQYWGAKVLRGEEILAVRDNTPAP